FQPHRYRGQPADWRVTRVLELVVVSRDYRGLRPLRIAYLRVAAGERAVLIEELAAIQNLAMPFTLAIEPPADEVRARATAIAREVALPETAWNAPVSRLDAAGKVRVRLGRAVALDPALLLLEHASASVARGSVAALAADIAAVASARHSALVALSADDAFARAVATRILTLQPATGVLKERRRGWF